MAEVKKVVTKMVEGLQMVGRSSSGHAIVIDQVKEVAGLDQGPQPMELFLMSLASCTGMDVISIMKKKRQDLRGFWVEAEGERAEEHPKVYTKIKLKFYFEGKNISKEAVERSIFLSQNKYCPVSAMLKNSVPIEIEYEIIEVP